MKHIPFIAGILASIIFGALVLFNNDDPFYLLFGLVLCFGYYLHAIVLSHVYALHVNSGTAKDYVGLHMKAAAVRFIFFGMITFVAWAV